MKKNLLVTMLLASLVVGCGGKTESAKSAKTAETVEAAPANRITFTEENGKDTEFGEGYEVAAGTYKITAKLVDESNEMKKKLNSVFMNIYYKDGSLGSDVSFSYGDKNGIEYEFESDAIVSMDTKGVEVYFDKIN